VKVGVLPGTRWLFALSDRSEYAGSQAALVQKLRELVRKERAKSKKNPQGRKPTPTVVRVLTACAKLLRDQATGRLVFRKADFAELTPEQVEEVKELREMLLKRMEEVQKLLPAQ
jgi:hypothetical protein